MERSLSNTVELKTKEEVEKVCSTIKYLIQCLTESPLSWDVKPNQQKQNKPRLQVFSISIQLVTCFLMLSYYRNLNI